MTKARRAFLIGPMLFNAAKGGTGCSPQAARTAYRKAAAVLKEAPGKRRGDLFIAVDQGLEFCRRAAIPVNLAVGDWDSLRDRRSLEGVPQITLPRDKDRSDAYYAIGAALLTGVKSVYLLGFSGGRPDHELANFLEAASISAESPDPDLEITFLSQEADSAIVSRRRRFPLKRGQVISVFAMGCAAQGVTLKGVRFPLRGDSLEPSSRGLSNVARGAVDVSVRNGPLFVIVPRGLFDKRT